MSETTETTTDDNAGGFAGTMEDIQDALGLPPETPEEAAAMARGEDPGAARSSKTTAGDDDAAAAPSKGAKNAKDDDKDADDKPEVSAEAQQLAEWAAVRKRASERRQAARAAARGEAPAARAAETADATATAAVAADKDKPAAAAKPSEVQEAVANIIAALEGLEGDDAAAADAATAGKDTKTIASKAAREANLTAIKEQLGKLAESLDGSKKARDEYGAAALDLRARLKDIEDTAFVENIAETTIARMETKLPHLSKHRNASKLLIQAAGDFLERNKRAAPMAFVAEKVERVLARRAQEANGGTPPARGNGTPKGASEKQHTSRKTVSAELATPPSRRQGDDKRTPEQVEQDLWNSLGIDPEA
jgi:hypothetical protein